MAVLIQGNAYQINQKFLPRNESLRVALPTAGITIEDCTASPTRSLPSGYNVYSKVTVVATGTIYYFTETVAQLVTAANT